MRRKTEENLNKIRQLYESGKTIPEIAAETGYKESSVNALLCKTGICRKTRRIDQYIPTMIAMRKNGASIKEIAEEVGFNEAYISQALCKAGCRKVEKNRAPVETSIDENNLVYADNTKRITRVVFYGKRYLDVTAFY